MRKIDISAFAKKFLRSHFYGYVVTGEWGSYELKHRKNGLIKYRIINSDKSFDQLTKEEILKEIQFREQIILMEGKTYFVVMNIPDSRLSCI